MFDDKNFDKYLQEQKDKQCEWEKLGLRREDLNYQEARILSSYLRKIYEDNHEILKESYPEFVRRNGLWMNDHYSCVDGHVDPRPRVWIKGKGYLTV